MTRSLLRLAALFLLSGAPMVLSAAPAAAQPATSSAALDAEARGLFQAGRSAYSDGRYEDALGHFRRSYELSHRPELLYNIGQCEDRLRHDAEAIAAFEAFTAALPDAPQHAEIAARLEILRASVRRADAQTTGATVTTDAAVTSDATTIDRTTDTVVTADADTPPVIPSGSDPAPWIVLGVGGAVVIVGAILLGVGYANIATVDNATNVPFSSVRGAYDDAPVLTGAGWAALGVGAALAGVGLVWALSIGSSSSEHARLRIGPTGLALSGSF